MHRFVSFVSLLATVLAAMLVAGLPASVAQGAEPNSASKPNAAPATSSELEWFSGVLDAYSSGEKRFSVARSARIMLQAADGKSGWVDADLSPQAWNGLGYLRLLQGAPVPANAYNWANEKYPSQEADLVVLLPTGERSPILLFKGSAGKVRRRDAKSRPDAADVETIYRWLTSALGYQGVALAEKGDLLVVASSRAFLTPGNQGLVLPARPAADAKPADEALAVLELVESKDEYGLFRITLRNGTGEAKLAGSRILLEPSADKVKAGERVAASKLNASEFPLFGFIAAGIAAGSAQLNESFALRLTTPANQSLDHEAQLYARWRGRVAGVSLIPWVLASEIWVDAKCGAIVRFHADWKRGIGGGCAAETLLPLRASSDYRLRLGAEALSETVSTLEPVGALDESVEALTSVRRVKGYGGTIGVEAQLRMLELSVSYLPRYVVREETVARLSSGLQHGVAVRASVTSEASALMPFVAGGYAVSKRTTPKYASSQYWAIAGLEWAFMKRR